MRVTRIEGGRAQCARDIDENRCESIPLSQLVLVRRVGEPIFPALTPIQVVENGHSADLHHILIEAENYHALQLLLFPYEGKIDCIYIDPPYNTGARDWKFNNSYVDANDQWRHSKWLSMMQRRLELGKRLLKPDTGVMIVTVDEHELHHLGMLLEKLFPETYRQLVTIVTNPKGVSQGRFSRVEEYAIFCFMQKAMTSPNDDDLLTPGINLSNKVRWSSLLRSWNERKERGSPRSVFPCFDRFRTSGSPWCWGAAAVRTFT